MSTLSGGPNTITDGLVLYLDAGNPSSYTSGSLIWKDLSKSNFSGSLINGPVFNSGSGGSIVFDGVNDYSLTNLDMTGYTDFTIGMFFKCLDSFPTGSGLNRALCGNFSGGSYVRLNINTSNTASLLFNASGPNTFLTVNVLIGSELNQWHYLTCTKNTTSQRVYIDGILKGETTFSNTTPLLNFYRAVGTYGTSFYWNGNISNYQIYNRSLTQTEILQNYNAQKSRFGLT
jgi:hypothetical protein